MTNSTSKKPSEKILETQEENNFDAKSVKSTKSAKSERSTKSVKSTKSAKTEKVKKNKEDDIAGGDTGGSFCCTCPNCPGKITIIPPKLRKFIECTNINELIPPIIPAEIITRVPSATSVKSKHSRKPSPTKSVRSVRSLKSVKSNDEKPKLPKVEENLKKEEKSEKPRLPKNVLEEPKSVTIKASVLTHCDCIKKNGLQDTCPNYLCQLATSYNG